MYPGILTPPIMYIHTFIVSLTQEFGWVGMPSLESLAPVLGDPATDYTIMSPNMQARENTIVGQQKVANMVKFNFGAYADPYLDVSSTNSFRRAIHMSMVAHSDCLRAGNGCNVHLRARTHTHSPTHTHSLTHSLTHSTTHSLTHSLTRSSRGRPDSRTGGRTC